MIFIHSPLLTVLFFSLFAVFLWLNHKKYGWHVNIAKAKRLVYNEQLPVLDIRSLNHNSCWSFVEDAVLLVDKVEPPCLIVFDSDVILAKVLKQSNISNYTKGIYLFNTAEQRIFGDCEQKNFSDQEVTAKI